MSKTFIGSTCHFARSGGGGGVAFARGAGFEDARSSVAMHKLLNVLVCSEPAAAFAAAMCASTVLGTVCARTVAPTTLSARPIEIVVFMALNSRPGGTSCQSIVRGSGPPEGGHYRRHR